MKKVISIVVMVVTLVVIVGLGWGVNYLFNYAFVRGDKDFISPEEASGSKTEDIATWEFEGVTRSEESITSSDNLKLKGIHFKQNQNKRPKLAIIAHGYTGTSSQMKSYADIFYGLGYDLFLPDARGHGESEGEYIEFGWPERLDNVQWIEKLNKDYQGNVDIVLFGISMGGATVMMTSGEKLPENVRAIVEDCGYDSVGNEMAFQLKSMFNFPAFPLIPLTSIYTKYKLGFSFSEASSVKQLEKNELPTLFIHGDSDKFVPSEMVYKNYEATKGPKELYIVKGAKHGEARVIDPEAYNEKIATFLDTYMPK